MEYLWLECLLPLGTLPLSTWVIDTQLGVQQPPHKLEAASTGGKLHLEDSREE